MGPGMSWYQISFNFEGFKYHWVKKRKAYYNIVTDREYKKPPLGVTWTEDDFISGWRYDPDDEDDEEDEYYD
jgi:hypothetical protein